MVKKQTLFVTLLAIVFPAFAFAGDFTAKVDHTSLAPGESFTLELTLSGGQEAKSAPDTQPLENSFVVESEGQSVSTSVINGKSDTTYGWSVVLAPRKEGKVVIPPLSIQTSSGTLSTEPITLEVTKAAASSTTTQGRLAHLSITASANTLTPYKGQLVFYTVKIVAPGNVVDISLDNLQVENAIVENPPKHTIYDSTENGVPVKIIVVHYIITPLASGKLTIPALTLRGKMQVAGRDSFDDLFSQMDADPFGMMPRMGGFGGLARIKPFALASNEVPLDVRPPAAPMDPWLPLSSLKLSETLEGAQTAKVGEPVTRRISMVAEGGVGKELPSLEPQQNHADFNVYADKPVTEDNTKGATIVGTRKESYSLIPLRPGKLVLPEIKVPWWDLHTNHIAYATLPAQSLDVLPAPAVQGQAPIAPAARPVPQQQPAMPAQSAPHPAIVQPRATASSLLYTIIGILSLALLYTILWALRMGRHANPRHMTDSALPEKPVRRIGPLFPSANGLTNVKTAQELNAFIRHYATEHWGSRTNASLEEIFSAVALHETLATDAINSFVRNLTGALYAGKETDIEALKAQYRAIIEAPRARGNGNNASSSTLPGLNPN